LKREEDIVKTIDVEPLTDVEAELGEGPLWSARDQTIYWIDVTQRKVFRHNLQTNKTEQFAVSGMPGSIALRKDGGIIAAFRTGLALIALAQEKETKIPSSIDFSIERFNDGKCDRRGRFFAGTMDKTMQEPIGALYRIGIDHSVTKVSGGIRLSNGIAWSPDDRIMYHCDSRPGYVYAYDYDIETGVPSNRRVHIDLSSAGYHPDGCTVDAEGYLWLACRRHRSSD
jgi:sugar lactone lactonase YvrE